jgi:adenine-specific DNA-methyltransferase
VGRKSKKESDTPATLAGLTAAPYNPRRITERALAGLGYSVGEFGDVSGIVFNQRTGRLVAGHQRVKALRARYGDLAIADGKITTPEGHAFPVRLVDWPESKEKAANIAANSPTIAGAFTEDLDGILAELKELELPTFEALDLVALLGDPVMTLSGKNDPDESPEPPQDAESKVGCVYVLGGHRLLCGDSTKSDDVDRLLGGQRPALVIGDPPYFRKVDADWDNNFEGFEDFLQFIDGVFALWIPRMIDRGTSGWWCAPDFAWHVEEQLRKHAAVFNHVVWKKGNDLGVSACIAEMRRWRPRSERLLLCEKKHSPYALLASFNAKTAHIASRDAYASIIDRLVAWQKEAKLSVNEIDRCLGTRGMAGHYFGRSQWMLPTKEAWEKMRPLFLGHGVDIGEFDAQRREFDAQRREFDAKAADDMTDVWEMTPPRGEERHGHPTPKPAALISKLVSAHSRPGDLVADPFLGSGTTIIAAEQVGRPCFGMEIEPRYVDVCRRRWAEFVHGPGCDWKSFTPEA